MAVDDVEGDGTTLASILAEMKDMKSEMNGMKGRLSRMDELEKKCQIQEENCQLLKAECGSLERSMQLLIKEQKWEYSAPSIPAIYWVNEGLDAEHIEGMGYLLEQLEGRTAELRSGRNIQNSILLSGGFEDDNDNTVLLHDDILLPHWEELANALQLYHNSSRLLHLSICHVQLTSSVIALLASALKGKAIFKNFELSNNEFVNVREGIDFAVKLVEDNPNLEQFEWGIMKLRGWKMLVIWLMQLSAIHPLMKSVLKPVLERI